MLKLRVKKGFTLLEVMLAQLIFILIVFYCFKIQNNTLNLRAVNKRLENYTNFIEAAASNMVTNNNYEALRNLSFVSAWYINDSNMNLSKLSESNITSLLQKEKPDENVYMKITVSGSDVLSINFEIIFNVNGKAEQIEYEEYKGCYN